MKNIFKSILGGVCIGLGCFAYLVTLQKTNIPVVASTTFYVGLSLILVNKYKLFTGEVYTKANLKIDEYVVTLISTWVGNIIGSVITAILLNQIVSVDVTTVLQHKIFLNPVQILIGGFFCNILVCSAVKNYRETKNHLVSWFFITCFVILGLDHSIANMSYIALGVLNGVNINMNSIVGIIVLSTIGNFLGGRIIYKLDD